MLVRRKYVFLRRTVAIAVFLVLTIVGIILTSCTFNTAPVLYETTDIKNYGNYIGNYHKRFPGEFINSFFPGILDTDSFEVVQYSYRAKKSDTYGFEAYLELRFSDTDTFNQYVSEIADDSQWEPFAYDVNFMEYDIENKLRLGSGENKDYYPIEQAKIRKVLYCGETQTIIYSAIGVYDGGGTGTDELTVFFDRFSIDPAQYAQSADNSYGDPYNVDYQNKLAQGMVQREKLL